MTIVELGKPLKSSRRTRTITTIVLHGTAGKSATSSINWLKRVTTLASYHYIIERDGTVYKCVPTSRQAWHAGRSRGPSGKSVNTYSIGIAFANMENGERLTGEQLAVCEELVRELVAAIPSIHYITTHWAVAPGRKTDPRNMDSKKLSEFANNVGLKAWLM